MCANKNELSKVQLYNLLGLDEETRLELAKLHDLSFQPEKASSYIYPLSQNSSAPPLGGYYSAKLERCTR